MNEATKMMWAGARVCVTGGAGFIGSQLVRDLLACKTEVVVIDDLSTGSRKNLEGLPCKIMFKDVRYDAGSVLSVMEGCDAVFHLAANADVRGGAKNPFLDLANVEGMIRVLEACAKLSIKEFYLASSATVYGDQGYPVVESDDMLPISHYAASKMACEAYVHAYRHLYNMNIGIFRIANVVGPRATHGAMLDFMRRLRKDPTKLHIYGSGAQMKPYVYVTDCTAHMLELRNFRGTRNITNTDTASVKDIANIVCDAMDLDPEFETELQDQGWAGDVVRSFILSTSPRVNEFNTSREALIKAAYALVKEVR